MLQQEFEERIGRSVSEQEYVEANAMYMLAGDSMDKDVFCREWQKIGSSALVRGLYETAYQQAKRLREQKNLLDDEREVRHITADGLLEVADRLLGGAGPEEMAQELNRTAWWLVGQTELTRLKVARGYRLDDKDREVILASMTDESE